MFSVCLPSDVLLQHLPSYLGFSYLGHGVSLQGCSSKAQPLLLTLDEGYLLTTTLPDLQCGIAPLGPPAPVQPPLLGHGLIFRATAPGLGHGVAPCGPQPWPRTVVKQEMARVNVDILGISALKWTGMGAFNSDDHISTTGGRNPSEEME